MRLSIAIDFTGSNGEQTKKNSLHYINPDKTKLNQYEEALKVVGSIVEQYDPEKKFPAIGFGGIPPGFFDVQHCFNLKKRTEYTEILGIEGVLKAYRKMIKGILLYGPTYFSPLLKQFKVWIENCPIEKLYHILLILTDGDVHDL